MNSKKYPVIGIMNYDNSFSPMGLLILTIFVLVYVDNLIITYSNPATVQQVVTQLVSKFFIKDLDTLSYFLSIEVLPTPFNIFLSQHKHIQDLLVRAKIDNANDMSTPMSPSSTLVIFYDTSLTDATEY